LQRTGINSNTYLYERRLALHLTIKYVARCFGFEDARQFHRLWVRYHNSQPFSVSPRSVYIMRYILVLLTLLPTLSFTASAQTKPVLQKQLFNMAQQSQQIQAMQNSDATAILKNMAADITQLHTQTLHEIVQLQGWVTKAQVTEEGVKAAFTLVSHSKNLRFQQDMLPLIIQSYIDKQGIDGEAVAIFTDQVSIAQGKNQVFGTQADLIDGKLVFFQIENEDSVDQLRAQMDLPTLAEYKKALKVFYGVEK
jgi:hypothetical protein